MIKDGQMKGLIKLMNSGKSLSIAAKKNGLSENAGRKYLKINKLPSQVKPSHSWRTRPDPFENVWPELLSYLQRFSRLEAKTLFSYLQRQYSGRFSDGQLRTLQRRLKVWRATEGPGKEVFFPQEHHPGELSASDFTRMGKVGITIQGQPFNHMVYHFVLTYSNWEDGTICFSESFESFITGFQNAVWKLGGVTQKHRTDSLSAAVNNLSEKKEFTQRYDGLQKHYRVQGFKTNGGEAHENGDIEQRHHRFKDAVEQALMLRGSYDFESRDAYGSFLQDMFVQLNKGREKRLSEELKVLRPLPACRLEEYKKLPDVRVRKSSTIRILHNIYSIHSRLRDEKVQVRAYADYLEVWYGQKKVDHFPRLRGEEKHSINYRHIIDWLVRKPGAFTNYLYKSDLFPTSRFRIAYDILKEQKPSLAEKEYLKILLLAAHDSEDGVDRILETLIDTGQDINVKFVETLLKENQKPEAARDPVVDSVNLEAYDSLLELAGVI